MVDRRKLRAGDEDECHYRNCSKRFIKTRVWHEFCCRSHRIQEYKAQRAPVLDRVTCEYRECSRRFKKTRKWQKFCCPTHRVYEHRERKADEERERVERAVENFRREIGGK